MMSTKNFKLEAFPEAISDPALCMLPGLFTSDGGPLEYRFGNEILRITMFEALGCIDLRVLQGLTAIASEPAHRARIHAVTTNERGLQILDELMPDRTTADKDVIITAKFLPYELARVIGKDDSKKSVDAIVKSLTRLYQTTIFWQDLDADGKSVGSPRRSFIISKFNIDKKLSSGQYEIGLNARISLAISRSGSATGKFTRIDMIEVRALRKPAARLIHQRLSGFINAGTTYVQSIKLETLAAYAWGDCSYDSAPGELQRGPSLYRQHRIRIRAAMDQLRGVGWTVVEQPGDKYRIGRPAIGEYPGLL